ncbi:MAG: outer membrane beta-barrel protein [Terracidiphilus sp.]
MRRFAAVVFPILLAVGTIAATAQVVPSATGRQVSLSAGGMASIFQPDFEGYWVVQANPSQPCYQGVYCIPISQTSQFPLFGAGAYLDLKVNRWVQFEAEGRWQRWNQYADIHQDNYLAGPRLPLYRFGRATIYGKTLFGFSKMDFGYLLGSLTGKAQYTDFAFGGGVDVKLTKRLTLRPVDFEYQYWPWWNNSSISPYGASVGMSYKIF